MKIVLFLAALLIPACSTPVPVYRPSQAPLCPVEEVWLLPCDPPPLLVEGDTFDQVLGKDATARFSLRECKARHGILANSITTCNDQIQSFNDKVKKLSTK